MKILILQLFMIFLVFSCNLPNTNEETSSSIEEDRLELAKAEKESWKKSLFESHKIQAKKLALFIRILKKEEELEVWAKNNDEVYFQKLKSYPFCVNSGTLGPKRKSGDRQIPEGLYHIDRFNEKSKFYLSLGINYPNESDKILSDKNQPGSDIFIHGDCLSIGCVAITDDKIKEVFILAKLAQSNGQTKIPVHIFPFRMSESKLKESKTAYSKQFEFWNNLSPFYQYFETKKQIPRFKVAMNGQYLLF